MPEQRVTAARGEADAEVCRGVPVEAALGEEPRGRRGAGGGELLGVELRGDAGCASTRRLPLADLLATVAAAASSS